MLYLGFYFEDIVCVLLLPSPLVRWRKKSEKVLNERDDLRGGRRRRSFFSPYLGSTQGVLSQRHRGARGLLVAPRGAWEFSQEVCERLLPAGDLHSRHPDRETNSGLFPPLLDHLKEPGDGSRSHAQTLCGAVSTNHGVGLTCAGRSQHNNDVTCYR